MAVQFGLVGRVGSGDAWSGSFSVGPDLQVEARQLDQRPGFGRLGHRLGLVDESLGAAGRQSKHRGQAAKESGFLCTVAAIRLAHTHRELERELPQPRFVQLGHDIFQTHAAKQHLLIQGNEINLDITTERLCHLAYMFAFTRVLATIGKGRHQADGDEGTGVSDVHA